MITPTLVKITNESIPINSGVDWIAIIALIVAIFSSVATLWWQRRIRLEDKKSQEEKEEKEDIVRKWNTLYPYRIKFYAEFYDTLYRFVYYQGSAKDRLTRDGTQQRTDIRIRPYDIVEFCNKFNRFTEEAKVLFDNYIHKEVRRIYKEIEEFVKEPISQSDRNLISYTADFENLNIMSDESQIVKEELKALQKKIYNEKLDISLRKRFSEFLVFSDDISTPKKSPKRRQI